MLYKLSSLMIIRELILSYLEQPRHFIFISFSLSALLFETIILIVEL
jgi:hypothetical protein